MSDLITALALVMVIEGAMPFLNPDGYKRAISQLLGVPSANLRYFGLALMLCGTLIIYFLRQNG